MGKPDLHIYRDNDRVPDDIAQEPPTAILIPDEVRRTTRRNLLHIIGAMTCGAAGVGTILGAGSMHVWMTEQRRQENRNRAVIEYRTVCGEIAEIRSLLDAREQMATTERSGSTMLLKRFEREFDALNIALCHVLSGIVSPTGGRDPIPGIQENDRNTALLRVSALAECLNEFHADIETLQRQVEETLTIIRRALMPVEPAKEDGEEKQRLRRGEMRGLAIRE